MGDSEQILLSRFSLRSEGRSGHMELLWPLRAMRDFLRGADDRLVTRALALSMASPASLSQGARSLLAAMGTATVELTAVLGETELPVDALAALTVGDVLSFLITENEPLALLVEGQHKWFGRPGVARGHRALRLTGT